MTDPEQLSVPISDPQLVAPFSGPGAGGKDHVGHQNLLLQALGSAAGEAETQST